MFPGSICYAKLTHQKRVNVLENPVELHIHLKRILLKCIAIVDSENPA